jgi:hypothetical protein
LRFSIERSAGASVLGVSLLRPMRGGDWVASAMHDGEGLSVSVGLRFGLVGPAFGECAQRTRADFAQSGQVFAQVFEDHDGNGRFDVGDAPVAGVRVRGASGEAVTDARGLVRFPATPNDRRTFLELDVGSLPDPWLAPPSEGVSIVARPGSALMAAFPLSPIGDIEGAAFALDGDVQRPVEGMRVTLTDAAGRTRSALTEFDGVWYVERVEAGSYRVCVDAAVAAGTGLAATCADAVVAKAGKTVRVPPILLAPAATTQADLATTAAGGG